MELPKPSDGAGAKPARWSCRCAGSRLRLGQNGSKTLDRMYIMNRKERGNGAHPFHAAGDDTLAKTSGMLPRASGLRPRLPPRPIHSVHYVNSVLSKN